MCINFHQTADPVTGLGLLPASAGYFFLLICMSFSSQSDDNLLKNIELFDKLSLRFNRRILFVKDVIGSQEICCWSFYGHGQKLCEVCCTSIVYGTDKKHTKVSVNYITSQHYLSGSYTLCFRVCTRVRLPYRVHHFKLHLTTIYDVRFLMVWALII